MSDRYDRMCDCVLVLLTPSDLHTLQTCNPDYEERFKRAKVNSGTRALVPDADCPVCEGTGEKPVLSAAVSCHGANVAPLMTSEADTLAARP